MTKDVELKELDDFNIPKVYKIRNRENKVIGCIVLEITLIRPWEKSF